MLWLQLAQPQRLYLPNRSYHVLPMCIKPKAINTVANHYLLVILSMAEIIQLATKRTKLKPDALHETRQEIRWSFRLSRCTHVQREYISFFSYAFTRAPCIIIHGHGRLANIGNYSIHAEEKRVRKGTNLLWWLILYTTIAKSAIKIVSPHPLNAFYNG